MVEIEDSGERILPARHGEISVVFSRHKFAYDYVQQFVGNKTVIDIGCGTGYGCKIFAEKAQFIYGIDYHEEAITYCKKHYPAPNIKYIQMDANAIQFGRQFDLAVSFQVIEHMPNLAIFISQLKQVVKPNGMIFITTPNVKRPNRGEEQNPFHFNEMNYTKFEKLMGDNFSSFEIFGVAYASPNKMRLVVAKLPFYKWGKRLKRKSGLKKIATRVLGLTNFKVIRANVERESADFLAVCHNEK